MTGVTWPARCSHFEWRGLESRSERHAIRSKINSKQRLDRLWCDNIGFGGAFIHDKTHRPQLRDTTSFNSERRRGGQAVGVSMTRKFLSLTFVVKLRLLIRLPADIRQWIFEAMKNVILACVSCRNGSHFIECNLCLPSISVAESLRWPKSILMYFVKSDCSSTEKLEFQVTTATRFSNFPAISLRYIKWTFSHRIDVK